MAPTIIEFWLFWEVPTCTLHHDHGHEVAVPDSVLHSGRRHVPPLRGQVDVPCDAGTQRSEVPPRGRGGAWALGPPDDGTNQANHGHKQGDPHGHLANKRQYLKRYFVKENKVFFYKQNLNGSSPHKNNKRSNKGILFTK